MPDTSLLFTLYRNRKLCANGNSSFLSLSETFRSMKNFFFVFLQCAEAWKTSFLSFCSVQKREKLLFCLSAMCRSMKNFFLAFLQCAEAWKTSFWPFWNVQKHEKLHCGLSEMFRSMFFSYFCLSAPRLNTKNLFFAFLRRALAPKISFLPFRAALKHLKSLFHLSAPRLST